MTFPKESKNGFSDHSEEIEGKCKIFHFRVVPGLKYSAHHWCFEKCAK